ncbi:aldo/keto reductase [Parapedobacter indicus]|uniref:Predicted oxidoreductase n=1 Tax=Parapedobacter indicus TaxID=1477437 RepID=A0A1I3SKE2_9SPHI|nr:aldo/keto reductase [Parapedobacter indicus]PPK99779.1 aryl-alcohol dehydrogenase-like predicted oxidoreductase [Parapedobacter indicus]SFJ59093.1 Predicted oxidoreductase [Parapedobacter indicus]
MNPLGKSDLQVSPVSFGCMSLGENAAQYKDLLRKAAEAGINYFDTADLYQKGLNELYVGETLKPIRKDVIIATKAGNQWRPDGTGWDWNPSKEYILKCAEQSLRRLKTDYIDLYQLHGGTIDDPIDETIEAFELLKQQGKIRWYGISSIRPNVIREYVKRSNIVSVMMQYSVLDHRPEEEVLDLLHQHGISVVCRGAVAQGLLLGKSAANYLQFTDGEVTRAAKTLAKIADESGLSKLEAALGYVWAHPAVATAALGIRTSAQLDDAILALRNATPLSDIQRTVLRKAVRSFHYEAHR